MSGKNSTQGNIPIDISVDSLKIRIPIEYTNIVNPSLEGNWYLVNESTGEVDPKEYKSNSLAIKQDGISTRFAIERQQTKEQRQRTFITLLVNSKELKENYFQGITKDTIKQVYNSLMSHQVVNISFDDFIKHSECTDVDIKKDARIPIDIYIKSVNQCRTISKPSKNKGNGYRHFNAKDNKGIEWSDRRTTSYKSNPFLKIYHKETELKNNSLLFASKHLQGIDYDSIVRIETTIKNAAHFRHLGIQSNKLRDILDLTQTKLQSVMNNAIKSHLEPRVRQIKDDNKLKPFELIIYGSILVSMQAGVSYESYLKNVLSVIENKTERNRKRKVINMIYDRFIKGTNEDKTSQDKDVFWNFLNW
jgi:hypothetical protein